MELLVAMLNKKFPNMTDHLNYHSPPEFYDNLLSNSIKLESSNNQSNLITNMDSLSSNPMLTTASMPIPQRNTNNTNNRVLTDLSEYIFDLESSQSPQMVQDISYNTNTSSGGTMYELQSPDVALSSTWNDIGGPQNNSVATKQEFLMEEEDIFQVDKADLIQGPTLAELNGSDNLYVDLLNLDEIIAREELSPQMTHLDNYTSAIPQSSPCLPIQIFSQQTTPQTPNNSLQSSSGFYDDQTPTTSTSPYGKYQSTPTNSSLNNSTAAFSPAGSSSSPITLNSSSITPPPPPAYYSPNSSTNSGNVGVVQHNPKYTTLHELLMKKNDAVQFRRERHLGQSVPAGNGNLINGVINGRPAISPGRKLLANLHPSPSSRLSSSAPTHLGLEQIWARREPRPHLLSTGSLAEAGSTSSLSTGGVLSPEAPDLSQDENSDLEDSDDHYDDYSSENDSDNETPSNSAGGNNNNSKSKRYFWQYNVQAKGPKGQRLVIKTQQEDPHVLNEITDPVFSPNCSVRGIKHSGKARKGDGNDLTPNPKKLHNIGKELDKLGRVINDMTPVSELPFNVRPKTRKEKNKLASRACRLKKKAQHEANKIKLYGLEQEHKRLINGISQMKQLLILKWQKPVGENSEEFHQQAEKIAKSATKLKIAGNTTEFVNSALEKHKANSGPSVTALEEGFQHYYT